jgi:hypothetical protein
MKPTKQTVLHDLSNNQHGNCLSAVLASLLHIPIGDVPLFVTPETWVKDLKGDEMNHIEAMKQALEAFRVIALAGMSGTGQESEEGMREWYASRAWEFIGIAARALDPLRAAIEQALGARVPEGYVLVPMEPTHEMRRAYHEIQNTNALGAAGSAWAAMLAAAPQPQPPTEQALVLDGWRWVPAKLLDKFPEINTSNYDHDDACELNAWGIEVVLAAQNAAPQPQPKQEPKMHSITADPHRANKAFLGSLDSGNFEKETGISVYRLGMEQAPQPQPYDQQAAAVLREREECAKVCDEVASQSASHWPYKLANKIRERNKP